MVTLFHDSDLTRPVNEPVLLEGDTYFLDTTGHNPRLVSDWLQEEFISGSIQNYHPRNKIHPLKFINVVGFVNILGTKYDVRSRKLYDGLDGNGQFKRLLDEVSAISGRMTFSFTGTAHGTRQTQHEYNWNDLEVLDYYYQLVFDFPPSKNLTALISQCMKYPSTANAMAEEAVTYGKSKKIAPSFFTRLGSMSRLMPVEESHPLASTAMAKQLFHKTGKYLLPLEVTNTVFSTTLNTVENRFLKFFLEEMNAVCLRVMKSGSNVQEIRAKAGRLQQKIHQLLLLPFFKTVQPLTFVPASSSVLLKRSGYREIYYHYVQSRLTFRSLLETQKEHAHKAGLKNMATLYEIWVFFKIAAVLFEDQIIQERAEEPVIKDGELLRTYEWKAGKYKLYYNKTYSKRNNGTYSIELRPDVALLANNTDLFLFDAKYKFKDTGGMIRAVKPEDIHKMHTYLDAISAARTAVVVFPGTSSVFYRKNAEDALYNGVGAIPLVPGQTVELEDFIGRIKAHYTETEA